MHAAIAAALAEAMNASRDLVELEAKVQELQDEKSALEDQLLELQAELSALQEQVDETQDLFDNTETEHAQLDNDLDKAVLTTNDKWLHVREVAELVFGDLL